MSDIVIKAENLGKKYVIGHHAENGRYGTLRDVLVQNARSFWHKTKDLVQGRPIILGDSLEEVWALKDVSFECRRGEAVGIIGRNGAGKSTLLKILSRITEPSSGRVTVKGRVASLLEVGTGFHPELTGRENIFLNGSILGMSQAEIKQKFDEIVTFAEIEKFLDTPVKRYSSGMYVRLAFAVAAHLESEILLVDEVLAVGDIAFQRKCLGKMGDVEKEGRTILFVSHNLGAIVQLCPRAIMMLGGNCFLDGDSSSVISAYLSQTTSISNTVSFDIDPSKNVQITAISIISKDGVVINSSPHTYPFYILINYCITKWTPGSYLCVDVFNDMDMRLLWSSDVRSVDEMLVERSRGFYQARIMVPGMVLSPSRYYITAAIVMPGRGYTLDAKEKLISIEITDGGSLLSNLGITPHAATMIQLIWETKQTDEAQY
jgi:lipopolysaccharide transport system ATP-binding protein